MITTHSPASSVTSANQTSRITPLIKRGNLVFLPQKKSHKGILSKFLVKKNQLEYPVLIKVYYSAENKYAHQEHLGIRLDLLKFHYAFFRNDPYSIYIEKQNLNSFIETVSCHSGNSWQVISVS